MIHRRVIALAITLAALTACTAEKPPVHFKSIDITGATYAQRLDLPDAAGARRHLADFQGKVAVVFFGYTQCPDVCPTALAEIAQMRQGLGADGARVQPVFVTIDPERDLPEILKAYVGSFGPDIVALRGSAEETAAAAKEFKIFYAKVAGKSPDSYTMDHTAGIFVFDPKGKVRLFARYGSGVEALTEDVKLLLSGA